MITVACLTSLVALNGKNPAGTGIPQLFTFTQTLERAQNDACGHPITGLAAVPPHPFVYAPSAFTVALQPISARGSSSRECQGMARGACAVSVRGGLAFSRPIPRARYADVDVAVRAAAAETILAFGNVPLARPVAPYGVGGVGAVRPLEEVAHGAPGSFAPACRWARWSRGPRLSVLCFRPLGDFFCGVDGDIRGCVRGSFASSNRGRLGRVGGVGSFRPRDNRYRDGAPQRDNWSILSRSGRAIAHSDEEPPRHSNGWRISVVLSYRSPKKEGDAEAEPRFRIIRYGRERFITEQATLPIGGTP